MVLLCCTCYSLYQSLGSLVIECCDVNFKEVLPFVSLVNKLLVVGISCILCILVILLSEDSTRDTAVILQVTTTHYISKLIFTIPHRLAPRRIVLIVLTCTSNCFAISGPLPQDQFSLIYFTSSSESLQ